MIRFTVPAVPVALPRQQMRVVHSGGRSFATNYMPRHHPVNAFKAAVADAASKAFVSGPMDGPLHLGALFVMPRPKSAPRNGAAYFSAKRPDLSNLVKSLEDALVGIAFPDDAQIAAIVARKRIASASELPRVEVEVMSLVVQKPEEPK